MKKRITAMILMGMMVVSLLSTSAFAMNVEEGSPNVVAEDVGEITPRLPETTVSKNLTPDSWTELYTDGNIFDEIVTITNNAENPGSIYIKITAKTNNGRVDRLVNTQLTDEPLAAGFPYNSPIIANSYSSYTVYLKAVDTRGSYSITYKD